MTTIGEQAASLVYSQWQKHWGNIARDMLRENPVALTDLVKRMGFGYDVLVTERNQLRQEIDQLTDTLREERRGDGA